MIHVIASITVKPGKREEFIDIFMDTLPAIYNEAGCIEYMLTVDVDTGSDIQEKDENVVTVIEKWESLDASNVHFSSPHMAQLYRDIQDLTDEIRIQVLEEV